MVDKKIELLRCGRELFYSKGYKDSNVIDITKMAGIAAGTFYNYYPSKDKLFMDIYMEENIKLKKSILESIDIEADPLHVMKEMMLKNFEGISANPILREWYNRDVSMKIEKIFREENGPGYVHFVYDSFMEMVKKWQAEGKMRNDIDAEMIVAIFAAIINIDTHKEEIGIQYFPGVLEYLAEFTMNGLIETS